MNNLVWVSRLCSYIYYHTLFLTFFFLTEPKGTQQQQQTEAPQATLYTTPSDLSILEVGESDFGQTLIICQELEDAKKDAKKVIATTFDTRDEACIKYKRAWDHITILEKLGVTLLFKVDASNLSKTTELKDKFFDRIVFNAPHCGVFGKEWNPETIAKNKKLIDNFMKSSSSHMNEEGQIDLTVKPTGPFAKWGLTGMARQNKLVMKRVEDFPEVEYKHYN
ncbi:hypothetical protein HanPI659440_Chr03g0102891 [Helianthus annuus]|nr:hypothetical protein HanPI659440_Chr03g0102891 [Helianthus annuus]